MCMQCAWPAGENVQNQAQVNRTRSSRRHCSRTRSRCPTRSRGPPNRCKSRQSRRRDEAHDPDAKSQTGELLAGAPAVRSGAEGRRGAKRQGGRQNEKGNPATRGSQKENPQFLLTYTVEVWDTIRAGFGWSGRLGWPSRCSAGTRPESYLSAST